MQEHDDDLESEVVEDAQKETDSFPNTSDELDELDDQMSEKPERGDDDQPLDDDATEL